ncbi:hypothetical protein KP725_19100 [Escherichia coli]|nr:hypothetical protein KP725_19100 [Escherichia coli]
MNIFEQTPPNRRRYGLAAFIGLIAGVVSAFVKWGAEVPLPPRSPVDMFKEGANKQVISSQADSLIKISRIWADFFPANTSNQPI